MKNIMSGNYRHAGFFAFCHMPSPEHACPEIIGMPVLLRKIISMPVLLRFVTLPSPEHAWKFSDPENFSMPVLLHFVVSGTLGWFLAYGCSYIFTNILYEAVRSVYKVRELSEHVYSGGVPMCEFTCSRHMTVSCIYLILMLIYVFYSPLILIC